MTDLIDEAEHPAPSATPLDRLKYLREITHKTQAQFARLLGIDPSSMSKILADKMPITEQFANRVVVNLGVSKAWFLEGHGVPFDKTPASRNISGDAIVLNTARKGAPVYDIDAVAGITPLSNSLTREHILGYIDMPNVDPSNPVIRVSGDSMQPRIPHGSYISIRPVRDKSIIVWGATYLVQLEDYRLVKVVKPCRHDPSKIILHSENPDYDDMEVRLDDVINLFVVEVIINCQFLA